MCWDVAKYINHSFRSNCLSTAYNFEIAIRDIQIDEELTDDYGYLNLSESFTPEDEGTKRKIVEPDDILKHYKEWDRSAGIFISRNGKFRSALIRSSFRRMKNEIEKVASGERKMLSTKHLYYEPEKSRI